MKAAIFYGPEDVKTEDVDIPVIEPKQILVKVKACGICGTDLHTYRSGLYSAASRQSEKGPILGHEVSGDVVEVGRKVRNIEVGDRVASIGFGGMAEYIPINVALGYNVAKLPPEISYEEAATLDPLLNSIHAMMKGNPSNNEAIVIFGAGTIGLGIIQCLRALELNLRKLIVIDLSDYRLNVAEQLGADEVINVSVHNPIRKIKRFAGSRPMLLLPIVSPLVDIVYECVGHTKEMTRTPIIQQALNIVNEFTGRIVVVGMYGAKLNLDLSLLVTKQATISGSYAWSPSDFSKGIELMETKEVNRLKIISHEFSLNRAKEAFDQASNANESLKVLIKP